jgi:hypothetical protein
LPLQAYFTVFSTPRFPFLFSAARKKKKHSEE